MLIIPTMTYSEKILVMVGSKITDQAKGMMTKGELTRATVTWKQAHFGVIMSGSLQLPYTTSKEDRGVGKEVTPSPSSNPAASRGFYLDDVQGPVCTTQKVTIPQSGTVGIHGDTGVLGHCKWVHVLAEPAGDPKLPASMEPTATYRELHPRSMSSNLPQKPEWPPHRSPCQGYCWQGHSCQSGTTGGPPDAGLRRAHSWPTEGMDPGSIESPAPRGVAWSITSTSQGAATQIGIPICLQQPGPGQDILDQAPDQVDISNSTQGALSTYTPHMHDDIKTHIQEMLDIGAIRKPHSPWASTVVLVWKKGWKPEVLHWPHEAEQPDCKGHLFTAPCWQDPQ